MTTMRLRKDKRVVLTWAPAALAAPCSVRLAKEGSESLLPDIGAGVANTRSRGGGRAIVQPTDIIDRTD
jgi:hypothetical protein